MSDGKPRQRAQWRGVIRLCAAMILVMQIWPLPMVSAQMAEYDAAPSNNLLEALLRSGRLPFEFHVQIYRTSSSGLGPFIGTITIRNTMIKIAGRDEPALVLKANLVNLSPGRHAFHIHEYPDCGPKEKDGVMVPGLAAGAHLFAQHQEGSEIVTYKSHLGNLPNLLVGADGRSTEEVIAPRLLVADLLNRSIMIHASQDDNSARAACGVFR